MLVRSCNLSFLTQNVHPVFLIYFSVQMYGSSSLPGKDEGWPALPVITHLPEIWPGTWLFQSFDTTFHHQNPTLWLFVKTVRFCSSFRSTHSKQKQKFTLVKWADIVVMSKGKMWRVRTEISGGKLCWTEKVVKPRWRTAVRTQFRASPFQFKISCVWITEFWELQVCFHK